MSKFTCYSKEVKWVDWVELEWGLLPWPAQAATAQDEAQILARAVAQPEKATAPLAPPGRDFFHKPRSQFEFESESACRLSRHRQTASNADKTANGNGNNNGNGNGNVNWQQHPFMAAIRPIAGFI
ncbi:hypothetical protein AWZ03_014764 [Drosophila navojoa]|uniref:Uncharacterized protein n=1 Tax=Drosophila navojoa TaxID=7232 RepID=A0A484AQ58_DRONA|nr:hypothetical protein AWZ03_014764 [Drosophila navojoa]